MQVSNGASNSAQMLQLAKSLTQGQNHHMDFQAGLNHQQGSQQSLSSSNTNGTLASQTTNSSQGTTAPNASTTTQATNVPPQMFNTLGNLNSTTNLKDFGLLAGQQTLLNQVSMLNQSIQSTQLAAMQPATFIQLSFVLKLFEQTELKYKQSQQVQNTLGLASPEAQQANEESQIWLMAFFERCNRLFEQQKNIALSRFLKKGPLGENMHETNTDDEYGTVFNDVDAETDYIKRYRRFKTDMLFHYSMLS